MNPSTRSNLQGDNHDLPTALYRAAQVRELDRLAIEVHDIAGGELMDRAGRAAFAAIQKRWPAVVRLVVVCGSGNNGGDGYVVARLAREAGMTVEVLRPEGTSEPRGDALLAYQAWCEAGGTIRTFDPAALDESCVIVDALLGTGLEREVQGVYAAVIAAINAVGHPVMALDIPSGLSADTGMPLGVAVHAAMTVTFVGLKQGLFSGQAPDYTGTVRYASLGVPQAAYDAVPAEVTRIAQREVRAALPPRGRSSHKGDNGHVLVIGGEHGMAGAARMAAGGAARVGAGLVSVATRESHAGLVALTQPEVMAHGVEEAAALQPLLRRASVLALGPGLGRGPWGRELFDAVVAAGKPLVVDADGLNLLAGEPRRAEHWVLTPHPGEAARLLECSVAEIQADRFSAVRRLQSRYGGVVVLKGVGTLVAAEGGELGLCTLGNPGMGSGGMGDVLTGVVAGLLAQGLGLLQAARVGVHLHAWAADRAARDGERGLLATDLYPHLRRAVNPGPP